MRSIVLFVSVLCLTVLGFGIYWMMQGQDGALAPRTPRPVVRSSASTMPSTNPVGVIGPVQGGWIDRYDKQGRLTSRIRAERYEPQRDGLWVVYKPEAEFFLHKDRVLRITGEIGTVTMQEAVARVRDIPGGSSLGQVPRMGDLRGVTITMHPALGQPPTLTMTMNNASFDNETFRIATEAYVENGRTVPADQVPVIVRGEDYEFDGRGLKLQYNEVDRRLENLRIEHGQRLLVKNADRYVPSSGDDDADVATSPSAMTEEWVPARPMADIVLAAAEKGVKAGVAPAPRKRSAALPTSRPEPQEPVYRAIFKTAVEIRQGGRKLASAEEMQIDFLTEEGEETVTAAAVARPASRPARSTARPTTRPASQALPPADRPKRSARRSTAAKSPTTRQADVPADRQLEIRWKGPLVVVPLPGDSPDRIAPGESIVRLVGNRSRPVEITREANEVNSHLRCATLTYWTIDESALLEEGPDLPVEMRDPRGSHIVTHSMVVSRKDGTAQLTGQSSAKLPLPSDKAEAKAAPKLMDVTWSDRCTLYFEGDREENMAINRAYLMGAVAVTHPQMTMNADSVDLRFDNSASQPTASPAAATQPDRTPQIQQVDAKGNVRCVVNGPAGDADKRRIECQTLALMTAHGSDGKLYARNLVAIGQVHVEDAKRAMDAGYLSATLAEPAGRSSTTQPSMAGAEFGSGDLQSMIAHDDVRITMADDVTASADELSIKVHERKTHVTLRGQPAAVKRKTETLSGQLITMIPETEQLMVYGAGSLQGMQRAEADKPARPFSVSWTQRLEGQRDTMQCDGGVVARTVDAYGAVNTAEGDRVTLTTVAVPTTQPADKKRPTTRASGELEVMANREIQSIILHGKPDRTEGGEARLNSVLADAKGATLRQFYVKAWMVQYFQINPKSKRLVIPTAGNLMFVDNREPAKTEAAKEAAADPMSIQGQTAFSWQKSLTYDEATERIDMLGDVKVRRIAPSEKVDLMLSADRIIGDIEPSPEGESTTRPADGGGLDVKMQLKHVRAEGNVTVDGNDKQKFLLTADVIEYDPVKHLLTARAKGDRRVNWSRGLETASFEDVTFNTQTWHVEKSTKPQFEHRK